MNAPDCGAVEHSVGLRWVGDDALLQRPCPFPSKLTQTSRLNNFMKREEGMKERETEKNSTNTGLCEKHRDYIEFVMMCISDYV
ncbi:Glycerol-3-phosphate dehydrogenase SDP6 [Dirofilaria immitis]